MRPILFEIFGAPVYSWGFMLGIGFIVSAILASREARRKGIPGERLIDLSLIVLIAGIVGARLVYVVLNWQFYFRDPVQIFYLTQGGLSFHGGLGGGILAGILYTKRVGVSPWKMADVVAPYIALATAIARIGCLLNGCCYGVHTDLPVGLDSSYLHDGLRHPTQIYSSIMNLTVFAILRSQKDHRKFDGYLMFLYVILYSIGRFGIDVLRDGTPWIYWLKPSQVVSIIAAVSSAVMIKMLGKRRTAEGRNARLS